MKMKKAAPPKKAPIQATGKPAAKGATTAPKVHMNPIMGMTEGHKMPPMTKGGKAKKKK